MSEQQPTPSIMPAISPAVPEIFDDEGRRVVRPDVINLITQLNIAAQAVKQTKLLQALYDHEKDLEGEGLTRLIRLTITDDPLNLLLPEPWQSFSITNDGEETIYLRVNSPYTAEIEINEGETLNYDTKTHKMRRLFMSCSSGKSSSVRIIGSY